MCGSPLNGLWGYHEKVKVPKTWKKFECESSKVKSMIKI